MTKILWICNIPIPSIAKNIGVKQQNICGWLTGFCESLKSKTEIELHIAFPLLGEKEIKFGNVDNVKYYSFYQPKLLYFLPYENQVKDNRLERNHIQHIIDIVKPDILHIFGTEYPHSMIAAQIFNNPSKTIVNIQGLTSFYNTHFNLCIPFFYKHLFLPSNLLRGNLAGQEKKMKRRGYNEIKCLKLSNNIIGRTDWDYACTSIINPNSKYYFCNETLRNSFYEDTWEYNDCIKHSIFMSQGATPIKGLHIMLQALNIVRNKYPDVHLYIGGNDILNNKTLKSKLKQSSYSAYLKMLIKKYKLNQLITFTGSLNEKKIKKQYLSCNVFVSSSTIENSPNSLGEAMILGVPCISSYVGGTYNLLKDKEEGFLYQADAPYMLAFYIDRLFSNPQLAMEFGTRARKHALETHNREKNLEQLLGIYKEVLK